MTTMSITQGQVKQIKRLAEDAVDRAIAEGNLDKDALQRLIEKGDQFQIGIVGLGIELSAPEPVRGWTEKDGVIRFAVKSDGTTGPQWIKRLKEKGFRLSRWAEDVLNSRDFKPTKGVTTEVEVLKGELFSDSERITRNIRADADKRKLATPNAEVACLIREMFSDEEIEAMGLWCIVAMHEPIKDSGGGAYLLAARRGDNGPWLSTFYGKPDNEWDRDTGFAFAVCK